MNKELNDVLQDFEYIREFCNRAIKEINLCASKSLEEVTDHDAHRMVYLMKQVYQVSSNCLYDYEYNKEWLNV